MLRAVEGRMKGCGHFQKMEFGVFIEQSSTVRRLRVETHSVRTGNILTR